MAVGDHGQLPPIHGNFNLMKHLDIRLEEIHRQARDNPIIKISTLAREVGHIPHGHFGHNIEKLRKGIPETQEYIKEMMTRFNDNTLVLCGYNKTRVTLNKMIRERLGIENEEPQKGDRVICLRNNHKEKIFNGMLGNIVRIQDAIENGKTLKNWYEAIIQMDDEQYPYKGLISKKQFNNPESMNFTRKRSEIMMGDLFDFGFAITVHKAQGSQASRVILIEERFGGMDDEMWKRWLYTGVTRAERELIIVG
jgi:exodeoxyribonuclease-5